MKRQTINFLVVSDIHGFDGTRAEFKSAPSWLDISVPAVGLRNPIVGLSELLRDRGLTADYLICCGDLGHQAFPPAIQNVWSTLHTLKQERRIPIILATAGNHDLDSRYIYNLFDARGHLQGLHPAFPDSDDARANEFWAQHFTVYEFDNVRLLLLNSAAYHGYQDEFRHGRLAASTIDRIRTRLQKTSTKPLNICICHHHPERHAGVPVGDYSEMKGGAQLTALLSSAEFGSWLVLHGHIHFPDISYAHGGSSSPILFSAGSLSAKLYPEYGPTVRNQAYLLSFSLVDVKQFGLCGGFMSWDWTDGMGWSDASANSGLPAFGGFGYRTNPAPLAQKIADEIKTAQRLSFDQLSSQLPELRYLIPQDLRNLLEILKQEYATRIHFDDRGCVDELEIT